jgi:hypothetical protein
MSNASSEISAITEEKPESELNFPDIGSPLQIIWIALDKTTRKSEQPR